MEDLGLQDHDVAERALQRLAEAYARLGLRGEA
jgi:hypothetical protein